MEKNKKIHNTHLDTFLLIRKDYMIGGIERCMYNFIDWLLKNNFRVIYLNVKGSNIHPCIKDKILNRIEVYEIDITKRDSIKELDIKFRDGENVLAYAFSFYYYVFLDDLKKVYRNANIHSYFWLAHYTGYFIEDLYPKFFRPILKILSRNYVKSLEDNNNIIYLNKVHEKAFLMHYNYKIKSKGIKYAFYGKYMPPFDKNIVRKRFEKHNFLIISIARLSFPHKGYLLGLVKDFARLKIKYPQLRLRIIGDGPNKQDLINEINKYNSDISNSIELTGEVFFDDLDKYCYDANLNISLAGGVRSAAVYGVPSLVVRHSGNLCTCETYGFLPDIANKTVCKEPGETIDSYINRVINMGFEEYLELSYESYKTYYVSNEEVDINYIKQMNNLNINAHKLSPLLIRYLLKFSFILAKKINITVKNSYV